jgi:hypothetical protein
VTFCFKIKKITRDLGVHSFGCPFKQIPSFGVSHLIGHVPHQNLPIDRAANQQDFQIVVYFINRPTQVTDAVHMQEIVQLCLVKSFQIFIKAKFLQWISFLFANIKNADNSIQGACCEDR